MGTAEPPSRWPADAARQCLYTYANLTDSRANAIHCGWRPLGPQFRRPIMGKKLYVGNLTYEVTDSALRQMFEAHGTVQSAQVIMDRDTGRSKGFGFVEMGSDQEAQAAIAAMSGKEFDGRALKVNEAKPREDRGGGGGRGGYGGG